MNPDRSKIPRKQDLFIQDNNRNLWNEPSGKLRICRSEINLKNRVSQIFSRKGKFPTELGLQKIG